VFIINPTLGVCHQTRLWRLIINTTLGICDVVRSLSCHLLTHDCCVQGSDQVDLVPHGTDIEVNASNVHDYVRKYAEHRMLHACQKSLEVSRVRVSTIFTSGERVFGLETWLESVNT